MIRPEIYVLNMMLDTPEPFDAFLEGAVDAYAQLGLLSDHEAARWRQRFADRERDVDPSSEVTLDTKAKAEAFLAGLIAELTPMRREMDAAAVERNAACDAAIWALYRLGVLDEDAVSRWIAAAWSKLTPWRTQPHPLSVKPRPYAMEVPVWAPPDTPQQAEEDAARAAKAALTARIDRVLIGDPHRQDGFAIVALVVHAQATSLHFHYLGRRATQIPAFEAEYSREGPDEAFARLTPPALHDNTGQMYQPTSQRPDPAAAGWMGPVHPDHREVITGYWLYTPAPAPGAHTFTIERDSHRWTLRDPVAGSGR